MTTKTNKKRLPTPEERVSDLAPPTEPLVPSGITGAVRNAVDSGHTLDYSPAATLRILRNAQNGRDLRELITMGMALLRRSPRLRSVMSTRVLAVTRLPPVVEPTGTKLKDRKAAEACADLARKPIFKKLVRHMMWGRYPGWSGAQTMYGRGTDFWPIEDFKLLPPQWFTFDPADGETPMLLPQNPGEAATYLELDGKYVFHAPQLLPGAPYLSGILYTAVFYSALVNVVLKQGTQFVELFAQPLRLGKFPKGADNSEQGKKDRLVLRKALENLGADAWAMIPADMQIEFIKDATVTGSIDVYERWARYFDELLAQLVLGASLTSGTGNTGSGGSQALGSVHNELRTDIRDDDADSVADDIVEQVFRPFVEMNFGPDVAVPSLRFAAEKAEELAAWTSATTSFMDRGLKVPTDVVYDRLNIRPPKDSEDTIGGLETAAMEQAVPAADATTQANSATQPASHGIRFSAEGPDAIDDLAAELQADDDYARANSALDDQLFAALDGDGPLTAEQLQAALVALVRKADVSDMQAVLTAALTAGRAAGEMGGNLDGDA